MRDLKKTPASFSISLMLLIGSIIFIIYGSIIGNVYTISMAIGIALISLWGVYRAVKKKSMFP